MIIPLPEAYAYEDRVLTEINLDLRDRMNPKTQEVLEAKYKREILRPSKDLDAEERGVYNEKPFMDKRFRFMVFEWITGIPQAAIRSASFPIETYNVILDAIFFFFSNWREPSTELPPEKEERQRTAEPEDIQIPSDLETLADLDIEA